MAKVVVSASWDDVPHLSQAVKDELWNSIPPHQRDARSKGIPMLGSGAIYPFPEESIKCPPFDIPRHWLRCFGLDTDAGAGWTAAVWLAIDREAQMVYLYDCYKSQHRETAVHIAALKQRGAWIPGAGDAKSLIVTEHDSTELIALYQAAGVDVIYPDKAVETGIQAVYDLFTAQRFKIFSTCLYWWEERRLYRRDEKGRIVKTNDHAMDATRYAVRSALSLARAQPVETTEVPHLVYDMMHQGQGWMGG